MSKSNLLIAGFSACAVMTVGTVGVIATSAVGEAIHRAAQLVCDDPDSATRATGAADMSLALAANAALIGGVYAAYRSGRKMLRGPRHG